MNIGRFQNVEFAGADIDTEAAWYFDPDEIKLCFSGTADERLKSQIDDALEELCEKHGADEPILVERIISISSFKRGITTSTLCYIELHALLDLSTPRKWRSITTPILITSEEAGGIALLVMNACSERVQFLVDWDDSNEAREDAPEGSQEVLCEQGRNAPTWWKFMMDWVNSNEEKEDAPGNHASEA